MFEKALKEDRPIFVDYFLRRYYDPLQNIKFLKSDSSTRTTVNHLEINTEEDHLNQANSVNEIPKVDGKSMRYDPESIGRMFCENDVPVPVEVGYMSICDIFKCSLLYILEVFYSTDT